MEKEGKNMDGSCMKAVRSEGYKYVFDKRDGLFMRWGKTLKDDPEMSPFGPEIVDMEVSTVCSNGCSFCYKSNGVCGKNMSFETFKRIVGKLPKNVMQIAFGIGDIDANPDLPKMLSYCWGVGVVPNITINGRKMTGELYDMLVRNCGAVSVSLYDTETCYGAVQELVRRGMRQVNIHVLLSQQTYARCLQVLDDVKTDVRLQGVHAVVFLWLKPKGDRNVFVQLQEKNVERLVRKAQRKGVPFGFDSCSGPMVEQYVGEEQKRMIEPCESSLFSYYINVEGKGFPCSFAEGMVEAVDVLAIGDFMKDVWFAPETKRFRKMLQDNCRSCPLFGLGCKG